MSFWSTVFVTAVVALLPISLNAIKHDIVGKIKRTFSLPKQSSLGSMKNVGRFSNFISFLDIYIIGFLNAHGAAGFLVAVWSSVLCTPAFHANAAALDDASFQGQLSIIREKQRSDIVTKQKESLEAQEKLFVSCPHVTHPVIARGVVTISPLIALENAGSSTIDPSKYLLGLPFATDVDSRFSLADRAGDEGGSDLTPTLFITAVGRDGPPLAAKKIRLDLSQSNAGSLMFPVYVELTTADLLFPYSDEVWRQLPLKERGDSISVAAVLDSDGQLSGPPSSADSFGGVACGILKI